MAYSPPEERRLSKPILQGLQVSSATAQHDVGYRVETDDGREFLYVELECSDVICYTGCPLVWCDTTEDYVVTPDISDAYVADEGNHGFAGVATMYNGDADNCYIWMQTKGLVDGALVSGDVAANDGLVAGFDTDALEARDALVTCAEDCEFTVVAIALTAASATGAVSGRGSTASIMLL